MEIRKFNKNDLNECTRLFIKVFEKEPWNDNWQTFDKAKKYIEDILYTPGFKGYIVVKDSIIISVLLGCIVRWWEGDEFFIKEFFVDMDYQRQGVGSDVLNFVKNDLSNLNVKNVVLLTEKDTPTFNFYKKMGLNENEKTVFMYQNLSS